MRFHIRGALGVQVISTMMALAHCIEQGKELEHITHNFGYPPDDMKFYNQEGSNHIVNVDCISEVLTFTEHKPIIDVCMGTDKIPYTESNFMLVVKHIDRIRELIQPKKYGRGFGTVLHTRRIDRPLVDTETYKSFFKYFQLGTVIGDDQKYIEYEFPYATYSNRNSFDDWFELCGYTYCIAGFSTFPLSAALLSEKCELDVIHHKHWNDKPENLIASVDVFSQLRNINWISLDEIH